MPLVPPLRGAVLAGREAAAVPTDEERGPDEHGLEGRGVLHDDPTQKALDESVVKVLGGPPTGADVFGPEGLRRAEIEPPATVAGHTHEIIVLGRLQVETTQRQRRGQRPRVSGPTDTTKIW